MKPYILIPVFILLALSLAACGISKPAQPVAPTVSPSEMGNGQPAQAAAPDISIWPETTQIDEQGAVVMEIKPINLNNPDDTLTFEVSMDTHSVDLGMDLTQLATLVTDTGRSVQAIAWDAPSGGHHVGGTLVFPSTYDGKPLLEGVTQVTISIKKVDADLRLFNWISSK